MKKVLLTTSALTVLMSGAAYADISLSGSARMGVTYQEDRMVGGQEQELDVEVRSTFNINGTATTDSGLEMGATIRFRSDENDAAGQQEFSGTRVHISNDMFKLSVGNVADVLDTLAGSYDGSVGLTGLGDLANVMKNDNGFSSEGIGGDGVRLDASLGGADFALSFLDGDNTNSDDDQVGASVAYTFGDFTVAVGHEETGDDSVTAATFQAAFSGFDVDLQIADNDVGGVETTAYSLAVATDLDSGLGLKAFISDNDEVGADTAFGVGFTYSLGGATLAGGIASDFDQNMRADFGVRTKF